MDKQTIKIDLTIEEVELFKQFRQYQNIFQALLAGGLLNFKNGTITFHYNNEGQIMRFDRQQVTRVKIDTQLST